jgi:hypothetical protein
VNKKSHNLTTNYEFIQMTYIFLCLTVTYDNFIPPVLHFFMWDLEKFFMILKMKFFFYFAFTARFDEFEFFIYVIIFLEKIYKSLRMPENVKFKFLIQLLMLMRSLNLPKRKFLLKCKIKLKR